MYNIERTEYGYKLTFSGTVTASEIKAWLDESKVILQTSPASFGIIVDLRALVPLLRDTMPYLQEGQKLYRRSGMHRSAVILDNAAISVQFHHIALSTGIAECERHIDADAFNNWEEVGHNWIINGVEPDSETD